MRVRHLRRGVAATAIGAILAFHDSYGNVSAFFFSDPKHLADEPTAGSKGGVAGRDVAAAALFGGGFFEDQGAHLPSDLAPPSPTAARASLSANVAQVLQQAVLSATSAAGTAAQQAAESASEGLEEARTKAFEWFEEGTQKKAAAAAHAARQVTKDVASAAAAAAHNAKERLYALGSLLHEKAPEAAEAAYSTAKSAGAAAGAAAEELSVKAKEAKSAFLNWAGHLRDEVRQGSNETVHSAKQAAERTVAAAEAARHAAVEAAEKATKAAQEARRTLFAFGKHTEANSAASADSGAQAAREASVKAEEAVEILEEASEKATAALASWGEIVGNALHAGTQQAKEAAEAVADNLQKAANGAEMAAETLHSTAGLFSSGAQKGAERADLVVDALTANASKPLLTSLFPWAGGQQQQQTAEAVEPTEDAAEEQPNEQQGKACACPPSTAASAEAGEEEQGINKARDPPCECEDGQHNKGAVLDAAKRFFGFAPALKEKTEKVESDAENENTPEDDGLSKNFRKAGEQIFASLPITAATTDLRPIDRAAWLGGSGGAEALAEVVSPSAASEALKVTEALPPVYKGDIPLDCDPLPPYRNCISECDGVQPKGAADPTQSQEASPKGLSSYDYSQKRSCYLACKSKWIDSTLPGCLDSSGKVVAGTPPATQFRSSSSTTTTTTTTTTSAAPTVDADERKAAGSSWDEFMKRLHNKESAEMKEDARKPSRFSWLFKTETTTTTTTPPTSGSRMFGSFFGEQPKGSSEQKEETPSPSWVKGIQWGSWNHSLVGNSIQEETTKEAPQENGKKETEESEKDSHVDTLDNSNTILLGAGAAVLLFALIFVVVALRRWEAYHRERTLSQERQQMVQASGGDIQQPLMQ